MAFKGTKYWLRKTIKVQKEHIKTLEFNLEIEKDMRKFYQRQFDRRIRNGV